MREWRFLRALVLLISLLSTAAPAYAQMPDDLIPNGSWYRNGATLDLDFYNDRYWLNGTSYSGLANFISGAGATFTRTGTNNVTATGAPFYLDATQGQAFVSRASSGTYFDNTGTLQTASSNVARDNHNYLSPYADLGTLIEPTATNGIRNNTMVGATTGVLGSGGALPTNWSADTSLKSGSGLSVQVVGTGTASGITYIDIRIYGTTTSSISGAKLNFESLTQIAAFVDQAWTQSVYLALSAGSLTGVTSIKLGDYERDSSGTYLTVQECADVSASLTGTLQRFTCTDTFSNASTARASASPDFYIPTATTVDFTLRIGMPQYEQSSYATSVIATSSATVTRSADVYSVPNGGTYFDGTGTLKTAPANVARLDHSPTSPYAPQGVLIEESRTNSIRNNTMVGAAVANSTELTTAGTFSGCSGATCTGWTTTVNGGTGSVSFGSNTATLTGDGTNAASIYQAIPTQSGYVYIVAITTTGGQAVTFQAGTSAGDASRYGVTSTTGISQAYFEFYAGSATTYIQINNASATAANVTAVSVQNAGRFPNNWGVNVSNGSWDNVTTKVVGTGTVGGINYIDLAFSGTSSTAGQNFSIKPELSNVIAATNAQAWTDSVYVAMIGGSVSNITSESIDFDQYSSAPAYLSGLGANYTPTATLTKYTYTGTTNNASTAYVQPVMYNLFGSGAAINITLRIGMPQLELGAFPTSVIATSGSTVTRATDSFAIPTSGGWYTAAQGTLLAYGSIASTVSSGSYPMLAELHDGTNNNKFHMFLTGNGTACMPLYGELVVSGSIVVGAYPATCANAGARVRSGWSFAAANYSYATQGTLAATSNYATVPSFTKLNVGSNWASGQVLNGWDNRITYFPVRQPDASLPDYTR